MKTILLTNHYSGDPLEIIKSTVPEGFELIVLDKADQKELADKAAKADYFLASGRLKINNEVLYKAEKLKMIQRTGVGLDSLDLKLIKEKGIPVYVNQGINADSVAEHTLLLILASLKRLVNVDRATKSGKWIKQKQGVKNHELKSRVVGLVGMGNIGKRTARMLSGFDVSILYYDVYPVDKATEKALGLKRASLNEVLENSDVVSLHCPLTDTTRHIINSKSIRLMKDGAILVNTARGPLVEEAAVIDALKCGKLSYAGFDVYEEEPPADTELFGLDNVVTTPHIGGITYDSFYRMMNDAMRNIKLFDEGELNKIERYKLDI